MTIWPDASRAQNSIGAVSASGSTAWVLIRRRNSSCSRSMASVVRADFHCDGSRRVKVNSRSPASSRLSATAGHFSRHLRRKALRRCFDLGPGLGVDHVAVVLGELVVQRLRRVGEQVAVLVDRAALDRRIRHSGQRRLEARAPSTMTKSGAFRPRASRSPRNARHAARLSPPMVLIASRIFARPGARRSLRAPRSPSPSGRSAPSPRCRRGSAGRCPRRRGSRRSGR